MTAVLVQGRKELRALLPWWAVVALATPVLAWATRPTFPSFRYDEQMPALLAYALGVLAIAANAVGHELSHGTLATLLVQPVSRTRVVVIKLAALAAALAVLGAIAAEGFSRFLLLPITHSHAAWMLVVWGPVAVGVGLVPLLTMITRRALGGVAFGVLVPGVVFALCGWFIPEALDAYGRPIISPRVWEATWFGTLALSVTGLAGFMWLFSRSQVAGGGGAQLAAAALPSVDSDRAAVVQLRARTWIWLTVIKELRLHAMTAAVSACFVVGCVVIAVIRLSRPGFLGPSFDALATLHAACICLIAGAVSSAEERQLGTWSAHLLTPRPFWQLWIIKCAVTLTVALMLSVAMPLVVSLFDGQGSYRFEGEFLTLAAVATVAAIYLSSLSTSSLAALTASVPAIASAVFAGSVLFAPLLRFGNAWLFDVRLAGWRRSSSVALPRMLEELAMIAALAAVSAVALFFAGHNHRCAERNVRTIAGQVAALFAASAIAIVLLFLARAAIWTSIGR